ncbi:MAG: serine/threonine protein kinase [Candidatus Sericytochromatia bacterium]|nr:serine/threonine protein kinase [Candidatus Tanganyikabacteria bacterium]
MRGSLPRVILEDGSTLEYLPDLVGSGAEKEAYFTADRSQVVLFFRNQGAAADPHRLARLQAILGPLNPTLCPATGGHFRELYCWPTRVVVKPRIGLVVPAYPRNYYFATGPYRGNTKVGRWFTSPRLSRALPAAEFGTWDMYLSICIRIARAVRRLHSAGLAHSDLSHKNVLVDPSTGSAVVIDIDGLVVPKLYPPLVLGTKGYIAPEVLATSRLAMDDPRRRHPSILTDQHALAVLLYEYLLRRHPLAGKKVHSTSSAEDDDFLAMGSRALFVEHPSDRTNPSEEPILVSYKAFGPDLADLFARAFVTGLHDPERRPAARDWESALQRAWSSLVSCTNPGCHEPRFVLADERRIRCPFCGKAPTGPIVVLDLRSSRRAGEWRPDGKVVGSPKTALYDWHVLDTVVPGEKADRTPRATFIAEGGSWFLQNRGLPGLTTGSGQPVPIGSRLRLDDGIQIRLAGGPNGRVADVRIMQAA